MVQHARFSNSCGFTLIEFLVAIVILMVGLLALLLSVNIAIDSNSGNKKRAGAVQLADEAMGHLKSSDYSTVITNSLSNSTLYNDEYKNLMKKKYIGLGFVNYSVYNVVTNLATNTKNVQVFVTWRDKGVKRTHSMASPFANPL